jgi:hypothetical protein
MMKSFENFQNGPLEFDLEGQLYIGVQPGNVDALNFEVQLRAGPEPIVEGHPSMLIDQQKQSIEYGSLTARKASGFVAIGIAAVPALAKVDVRWTAHLPIAGFGEWAGSCAAPGMTFLSRSQDRRHENEKANDLPGQQQAASTSRCHAKPSIWKLAPCPAPPSWRVRCFSAGSLFAGRRSGMDRINFTPLIMRP